MERTKLISNPADSVSFRLQNVMLLHFFPRAFACEEYFYNMEGDKADILRDVLRDFCVKEDTFTCERPYQTLGDVLGGRVSIS